MADAVSRTVGAMNGVHVVDQWPVDNVAVAVIGADGARLAEHGPADRVFELASVTKLLSAYGVLIAVEEGALELDQPAGPAGSTIRHLLAHASGLAFNEHNQQAEPGNRRIYSSSGYEVLADEVHAATGIPFDKYLSEAVFTPLGMRSAELRGSAGHGAVASCADLVPFAAELQAPQLIAGETLVAARTVQFPGLNGVVPGFGMQRPCDWGLGFELRGQKSPHWTGELSSPETFGHFGQAGTFLWVDPAAGAACIALTDRVFGDWAKEYWPPFTDGILRELA